ncbi:MAG: N-acetylmuramoyl-L-alanine amidase [Bacteroidaceae bacterium]|nr:N-acetylmuramoyl-L-alanine amidase [Bacteroidaceae bacterium]
MNRRLIISLLIALYIIIGVGSINVSAQSKPFLVVLDAGHGGQDAGCIGSQPSNREKDIVLSIVQKVNNLIKNNCTDVKTKLTRDADFFVSLNERANIANKAKADLFVSVHVNSVENRATNHPMGVQAYTLTLRTAAANLEIEKRENSVIQYEADGAQKYSIANDKSSESDIMFELMQDRDMQESVDFATIAQNELIRSGGRKDRGVLQANFAVLRQTYMPSVLLEVGFICNLDEERFLMSDEGRTIIAKCIFNAIVTYKAKQTGRMSNLEKITPAEREIAEKQITTTVVETPTAAPVNTTVQINNQPVAKKLETKPAEPEKYNGPVFKVQIFASSSILKANAPQLKGCPVEYYQDGGAYKYTYGLTTDYNEALRLRKEIANKFPQCFIVAFLDGKRIDKDVAVQQWKKLKK